MRTSRASPKIRRAQHWIEPVITCQKYMRTSRASPKIHRAQHWIEPVITCQLSTGIALSRGHSRHIQICYLPCGARPFTVDRRSTGKAYRAESVLARFNAERRECWQTTGFQCCSAVRIIGGASGINARIFWQTTGFQCCSAARIIGGASGINARIFWQTTGFQCCSAARIIGGASGINARIFS